MIIYRYMSEKELDLLLKGKSIGSSEFLQNEDSLKFYFYPETQIVYAAGGKKPYELHAFMFDSDKKYCVKAKATTTGTLRLIAEEVEIDDKWYNTNKKLRLERYCINYEYSTNDVEVLEVYDFSDAKGEVDKMMDPHRFIVDIK